MLCGAGCTAAVPEVLEFCCVQAPAMKLSPHAGAQGALAGFALELTLDIKMLVTSMTCNSGKIWLRGAPIAQDRAWQRASLAGVAGQHLPSPPSPASGRTSVRGSSPA